MLHNTFCPQRVSNPCSWWKLFKVAIYEREPRLKCLIIPFVHTTRFSSSPRDSYFFTVTSFHTISARRTCGRDIDILESIWVSLWSDFYKSRSQNACQGWTWLDVGLLSTSNHAILIILSTFSSAPINHPSAIANICNHLNDNSLLFNCFNF